MSGKKAKAQAARARAQQTLDTRRGDPRVKSAIQHLEGDNSIVTQKPPRVNWYLMMLLDPTLWEEALANGVRGVPDFYSHRNHIFVTRTVHDLDTSNFDASGKCTIFNRPSLRNHLSYSDNFGVSNNYHIGSYERLGNRLGLKGSDPMHGYFTSCLIPAGNSFVLPTTGVLDCVSPSATDCLAIMAQNPTGAANSLQYPITANAANTVNFQLQLSTALAGAGGDVTVSVNTDGGARSTAVTLAAGDTTVNGTITLGATDTWFGTPTVQNTSTGVDLNVGSAYLYASIFSPSSYTSLLSESAQNFDLAVENLTAVRPVAGYCWVKYRGKLTSNGSIAGALIDSAANPVESRVSDYDTIAGLLHSYEGSLTNGNYTIWCPMNPADTNYTDVYDMRQNAPFITVGIDADDVDSQQIRLECFWVWEGLTQNQMLAPKPGSVDIGMMNDAFEKLAHFDKSMENDLHLKKIASFLKGTFSKGAGAVKSYLSDPSHRRSIISAAEHLLSLASGLSPAVSSAARVALAAARSVV